MRMVLAAVSLLFAAAPAFAQCSDADKKALEAFDRTWGEATTEEFRGKSFVRSSVATISGSTVVLAQSIVAAKDGQAPAAANGYAAELLKGGVRHLEKLGGSGAPVPVAVPAATASASPATN